MTESDYKEIHDKIFKGLKLTYKRLLIEKQKNDEDLVISRNGEIIKIKARDLAQKPHRKPTSY
jgi:hypothetical protein